VKIWRVETTLRSHNDEAQAGAATVLAACAVAAIALVPARMAGAICSLAGDGLRALAEVLAIHGLLVGVAALLSRP